MSVNRLRINLKRKPTGHSVVEENKVVCRASCRQKAFKPFSDRMNKRMKSRSEWHAVVGEGNGASRSPDTQGQHHA